MHQSISNTVAGGITSYPEQAWHGVINEAEVRAMLRKYPDAVMFSGHSHWTLNSYNAAFDGQAASLPYAFTTSSVAAPQNMQGEVMRNEESEGYIIEIYEDKIMVRGRDFKRGLWMASAQFVIDYSDDAEQIPPADENDGAEDGVTSGKPQANKKPSDTNEENVEDQTDETDNVVNDQTEANTEESSEVGKGKKSGCGSAIGAVPIALAVAPAALALKKKKKKD